MSIVNYASSGINKLKASLNDDARVVIYDCHMFIVQATEEEFDKLILGNIFLDGECLPCKFFKLVLYLRAKPEFT